jgi:hypothetical protein
MRAKLRTTSKPGTGHAARPADVSETFHILSFNILYLASGFKEARFFVISNHNLNICDFDELVSYVKINLPELKCEAAMFSLLGELTDDIIDAKYKMLKERIWKVSLTSAGLAACPVPGLDVVLNFITY